MKAINCCFAALLLCSASFACLNEHHVNKSGKTTSAEFVIGDLHFYKRHNAIQLETYINNLQQKKNTDAQSTFENENSIAVALIKLGRLDEAEAILNRLYEQQPKDYSIVANLGTLYELQGKNEKALEFIKKSISIDPNSHDGSEWFHIKVLEFKLKNIPEEQVAKTDILQLGKIKKDPSLLAYHISYQLKERIPFMPAPNMLIAKILDEYATYLADNISITGAYLMYSIGQDYDRNNILQFTQKKEALKPYFKKYKQKFPVLSNHYSDPVIDERNNKTAEAAVSVLDKGISILGSLKQEKERNAARQKKQWAWGIGLVSIGGLALYLIRRRKLHPANIA